MQQFRLRMNTGQKNLVSTLSLKQDSTLRGHENAINHFNNRCEATKLFDNDFTEFSEKRLCQTTVLEECCAYLSGNIAKPNTALPDFIMYNYSYYKDSVSSR